MSLFDLLFVVLFLSAIASLIVAAVLALRGRRPRARIIARRVGIITTLYFGVLLLVSALSPQRYLAIGDEQCSDDWCISVSSVQRVPLRDTVRYDVAFRLASHARRVPQRERFVAVFLRDLRGHQYAPTSDPSAVPFDTLLAPMQALAATRRFSVPSDAGQVGLVVTRDGAGWFPRCCIIDDEGSLLHRRAMVKLD